MTLNQQELMQMQKSFAAWSEVGLLTDAFRAKCAETSRLIGAFLEDPTGESCAPMVDALLDAQIASDIETARLNELENASKEMRIAQALGDPCQWVKELGRFLGLLSETHARKAMECFADEFAELGSVFSAARVMSPAGLQ